VSIVEEIRNLIETPRTKTSDPIGFRMPVEAGDKDG
jgi:hypothetical protein